MGQVRTCFITKFLNLHLLLTFAQKLLYRRPVYSENYGAAGTGDL